MHCEIWEKLLYFGTVLDRLHLIACKVLDRHDRPDGNAEDDPDERDRP